MDDKAKGDTQIQYLVLKPGWAHLAEELKAIFASDPAIQIIVEGPEDEIVSAQLKTRGKI